MASPYGYEFPKEYGSYLSGSRGASLRNMISKPCTHMERNKCVGLNQSRCSASDVCTWTGLGGCIPNCRPVQKAVPPQPRPPYISDLKPFNHYAGAITNFRPPATFRNDNIAKIFENLNKSTKYMATQGPDKYFELKNIRK